MNNLILIGNGFDRAHGLPTSYSDFFYSYMADHIRYAIGEKDKLIYTDGPDITYLDNMPLIGFDKDDDESVFNSFWQEKNRFNANYSNLFLQELIAIEKELGWIDIENLYMELIMRFEGPFDKRNTDHKNFLRKVEWLNLGFDTIKNALEVYLLNVVNPKIIPELKMSAFNRFFISRLLMTKENYSRRIESNRILGNSLEPMKNLVVNFNYTATFEKLYVHEEMEVVNVHGELNNLDNPMIFGYGDVDGPKYEMIENANENIFMEHSKLKFYNKSREFDKVIDFLNQGDYKVTSLGLSCGLTDRLLLGQIFNDENCKEIEIGVYDEADFDNIAINISRFFKNAKGAYSRKIKKMPDCFKIPQKS